MRYPSNGFYWSPDEQGGGDGAGESAPTNRVEIDGQEVDLNELVTTYKNRSKMDAAAHRRNEEIKREQTRFKQEADQLRQRFQQEREQLNRERQQLLTALPRHPERPSPRAEEPVPSFQKRLEREKIDLVGDDEAPIKLARLFDSTVAEREKAMASQFERKLKENTQSLEKTIGQKLSETGKTWEQHEQRKKAREEATTHNRKIFEQTLKKDFPEVAERLDEGNREAVWKVFEEQIGPESGTLDKTGQWRWNENAVRRAVWAAEPSRQVMLAGETAKARSDGLKARIRGEGATTPLPRQPRRTAEGGASEEALRQKIETVNQQLAGREISEIQAADAFTSEERRQIAAMRRR